MHAELVCDMADPLTSVVVANIGEQLGVGQANCQAALAAAQVEDIIVDRDLGPDQASPTDALGRHALDVVHQMAIGLDDDG